MIGSKLHILLILFLALHTLVFPGIPATIIVRAFNDTDSKDTLLQSSTDLSTNILTVPEYTISIVQSVTIPDRTMKSGDQVIATIKVKDDKGLTYKLNSGDVGGYQLTNLLRVNKTNYTAVFEITEGGNDYLENEDIPVSNLVLYNRNYTGIIWNKLIVQGNDLLDANTPAIIKLSALSGGKQKIGSTINLLLTADESGYFFEDNSNVNNISFSDTSITVMDLGKGNYSITYKVEEGDESVASGAMPIQIILRDRAGNTCNLYTSLSPNDISIDALRPVITRAFINSTDEDVTAGENVEITVVADYQGYSVSPLTRVNNVSVMNSNLIFSDTGNGLYQFVYTVEVDEGIVSAGNLAISIILVDSYGNESLEFTSLDPNNVTIYSSKPSAAISGTTTICTGDSARLTISFGGMAPWKVELSDGSTTRVISNILDAEWQFFVDPVSTTTYIIVKVTDGTSNTNTGIGSAKITVNSLLVVEIINLLESYDVDGEPVILEGTPAGGTFNGPGVTSDKPQMFYPVVAGTIHSPHRIIYTFTNLNGCTNRDTAMVNVIRATGTITFEKPMACFNDTSFIINGSNTSNTIGQFSIQPDVAGALVNYSNNSATLNPSLLNITETITAIVTYTYPDASGLLLDLKQILKVEKLDKARITPMADIQFCNNENPVVLYGNYPDKGIFTGGGVTGNVTEGFKFNPRQAGTGLNSIRYTYESSNGCTVSDSIILINYSTPKAGFSVESACIVNTGGVVQFINESDTLPGDQNSWSWNFGDPISGSNNFSTKIEPSHFYNQTGQKSVSLIVANEKGCSNSIINSIVLRPNPKADFEWSSECLTSDAIVFNGTEKMFTDDFISIRKWKFYDTTGNLAEVFTEKQILYNFESPATYSIGYNVMTNYGCSDSIKKEITLIPTFYIAEESYNQNFETAPEGWFTSPLSAGGHNSWALNQVDSVRFPYKAAYGRTAWYTMLPQPELIENSAVLTPCFSFENVGRPLMMLDIKRSMDRDMEGAVIQYTADNGKSWKNIGIADDGGLNWYNSTRIINGPAGQSTGWTGTASAGEDPDWLTAAHHLDELINKKEVRFRIVYGSRGDNTVRNEGFAFDNFRIRQRSRTSVMEYFTNANDYKCVNPDTLVNTLANNLYRDVFDIHYHTGFPSPDRIYLDNPIPSSARGLYYGISDIPYSVIDGGGFDPVLNHERNYNFTDYFPNSTDILIRTLLDPDFNIYLGINQLSPSIQVTINIEALKDIPKKELTLHTVILEVMINDPLYIGTNGVAQFESVARQMLPDAGGTTFNKAWLEGETDEVIITWNKPFEYLNEDNIAVVVFLQDYNTREIFQAAGYSTEDYATSSHGINGHTGPVVNIYPNPAIDFITIDLGNIPENPVLFRLYDLSGKCILEQQIPAFQKETIFNLEELKHGLYIIEIREKSSYELIHYGKLILN